MLESGLSGSVRGVPSDEHPYRDPRPKPDLGHTRPVVSSGHSNSAITPASITL
jgi:hypothetical protein